MSESDAREFIICSMVYALYNIISIILIADIVVYPNKVWV
jgi:hypothetical protein